MRYCKNYSIIGYPVASRNAHHASGLAAGAIATIIVYHSAKYTGGELYFLSFLTMVAGWLGGTAPDWMEIAWWRKKHSLWITHRTVTHWGIGWLLFAWFAYSQIGAHVWAPPLLGFAAGGVMHLLADWPNPMGVPWIYKRHSLRLWKSGRCDSIVVGSSWLATFILADLMLFEGIHMIRMIALAT